MSMTNTENPFIPVAGDPDCEHERRHVEENGIGCLDCGAWLPDRCDPRIRTFYDNAEKMGMTPGDYAVFLLGKERVDAIETARQEEAEDAQ